MAVKIFSYRRGTSFAHKMPPLLKIALLVLFSVFVFSGDGNFHALKFFSEFAFVAVFFFLSQADLKSLFVLRGIFLLGFFVTIFRTVQFPSEGISFSESDCVYKISEFVFLSKGGFFSGVLYTLNFFFASFFAELVFETTSPMEIKFSLDDLQENLARIFPPLRNSDFAMVISLAINFIPEVFDAWQKISLASKSRLGEKTKNPFRRVAVISENFVSLFSFLLRKAETKRMAMLNRSEKIRF